MTAKSLATTLLLAPQNSPMSPMTSRKKGAFVLFPFDKKRQGMITLQYTVVVRKWRT